MIRARILAVEEDRVQLVRDDGRSFDTVIDRFSRDDQEFIRAWKGEGEPLLSSPSTTAVGGGGLYPKSKSEIKAGIRQIRERDEKQWKKFDDKQREAIAELNVYRYLSGVPAEVELDADLIEGAQSAAEACKEAGLLDHGLNRGTANCNLSTVGSVVGCVHQFIADFGANNRAEQGHRHHALNPRLGKTGFGSGGGQYSAMWSSDRSGKGRVRGDFWAYPGEGFYPASHYRKGALWTVYLTNGKPKSDRLKVRVFEVGPRPKIKAEVKKTRELDVPYVNVYGNSIVFEPKGIEVRTNARYWVEIDGAGGSIEYIVEFFDM